MLEDLDVTVRLAGDGKAAYDLAAESGVDLVLMDCQMPEWDGLTATRAIRAREAREGRPRLPVVALTANAMADFAATCRDAGMDDYLSKPLRQEELAEALSRQLPGRAVANRAAGATEASPPALPPEATPAAGFDLEKLRRICRDDPVQVNEMLSLFVSSTESLLTDLARAVEQRDAVQAARQAHQIRGAAAYLGAGEVTGLAGEVEAHAKARDWDPCATAVEDLEAAFIRLRLEIDDQLGG